MTGEQAARWASLTSNEEAWRLPWRVEVKSGAQAGPVATRYLGAEKQADAAKAVGDARPLVVVFMPHGWGSDGLLCCRLSVLPEVMEA